MSGVYAVVLSRLLQLFGMPRYEAMPIQHHACQRRHDVRCGNDNANVADEDNREQLKSRVSAYSRSLVGTLPQARVVGGCCGA